MQIKEEAKLDVLAAAAQYARADRSLGNKFIDVVYKRLKNIEQFPEANPLKFNKVRRAIITSYPYSVYYRIENNDIVVYAVLHNHAGVRAILEKISQVQV
jgi:toxin ParE1/3/4